MPKRWYHLLILLLLAGCCNPVSSPGPPKGNASSPKAVVSDAAEEILCVVEDERLPIKVRADAAAKLGTFKEAGVIDRLGNLLPGGYDLLTLEIVNALGKIGDERALPALERVKTEARKESIEVPGKINADLDWAIHQCRKEPGDGP